MRSVRVLVLDSRGLEQGFHDVTIVDMGDLPESPVSMNNCHFSASNGHLRSSVIWFGCSRTWMRCAWRPRNGFAIPGRDGVHTASHGSNVTCIVMWLRFTWTWHSCGGAWCPGARCGRARHRIAWIMFEGHMMCHGMLSRPV